MIKQSIRSFGFGLLASSASLFIFSYIEKNEPAELSTEEIIQLLKEDGYNIQKSIPEKEAESASDPQETNETKKQAEEPAVRPITMSVEPGMSSNEIAAKLKELGVIEQEAAFNQYLTTNGYADKLQVGSYTFQNEMTDKEIAEVLTN
ncbi:endolytic transglycosylase MltG [Domibacillus iocasae]|uniref:Aminodeoxychorismate lyase n=1 Tax=Domibacillus iocasae TaxID=1714016 RepID=A0A1E7DMS1_9BACI|nr:endolytic transglycosylase MltG [Domibacillus iocasae]OES44363.1 hypothetical protein BA724_08750 [Domibacillus iocasae]